MPCRARRCRPGHSASSPRRSRSRRERAGRTRRRRRRRSPGSRGGRRGRTWHLRGSGDPEGISRPSEIGQANRPARSRGRTRPAPMRVLVPAAEDERRGERLPAEAQGEHVRGHAFLRDPHVDRALVGDLQAALVGVVAGDLDGRLVAEVPLGLGAAVRLVARARPSRSRRCARGRSTGMGSTGSGFAMKMPVPFSTVNRRTVRRAGGVVLVTGASQRPSVQGAGVGCVDGEGARGRRCDDQRRPRLAESESRLRSARSAGQASFHHHRPRPEAPPPRPSPSSRAGSSTHVLSEDRTVAIRC